LPPLKFKVETNANGEPYIKITSVQPINEPFVNLLVELTWSSGKLLREYTFLLDPLGYVPTQPQPAEVKPVEPSIVGMSELEPKDKEVVNESPLPSTTLMVMADEKKSVDGIPAVVNKPNESSNAASGAIKVKRGDTLSKLALQTKSSDVSLERALVALYQANTNAFDGKNMNRLKTGAILHMPEQPDLDNLSQVKAVKEIRAQSDNWHAYRQKLAAASGLATGDESKQGASGKISTAVTDNAPAVKESAKEVVRLSKGEAPGDKTSAGDNAKTLQNKVHSLEEDAIAKSKALQESNERVVALEKNVKDLQRLIDLKSQSPAAQVKPVPSPTEGPAVAKVEETKSVTMPQAPVVASQVAIVSSEVAAVSPVKLIKPITKPKLVAPQPSLLDVILDEPLYLVGGAAALLGLIGLGYLLTQRNKDNRRKNKLGDRSADHIMGSSNQTLAPDTSPQNTGDFASTASSDTRQVQADDFDPISSADLFLNFSRDEQAEKVLIEALSKNQTNPQIHLKLLSIYANRKDVRSFATIAHQLRDLGDENAWEQATIMGRNLEPNNPMYGGNVSAAAEGSFAPPPPPDVMINEDQAKKTSSALDFDLDLDFSSPKASTDSAEASLSSSASTNITLDFPNANMSADKLEVPPVKAVPKEIMDIGLSDISLNLDKPVVAAPALSAEERDAHWHNVATKLDLAKAYQEMGDAAGARAILEEVVLEGDEEHRTVAEALLQQLSV